jgi:hypothetical protein
MLILGYGWIEKSKIISYLLSKDYGVPVSIENIFFSEKGLEVEQFNIKNPKKSRTETAVIAENILIKTTRKQLLAKRRTIELIGLKNVELGIEFYNSSGSDNNWSNIIKVDTSEKKKTTPYLIKRIVINNLQVTLTKADGTSTKYPIIDRIEFNNITNESGFPINELEKAIFHVVLKSIFEKFGFKNLIETLNPINYIPDIIKFPFVGDNNEYKETIDNKK